MISMSSVGVLNVLMWCVVSVNARLNVNVALKRKSYQVSTLTTVHGIFYPQYANDGGHGTDALYGPCMHTLMDETYPWWAVDLGVALYVYGIKFTNRDTSRMYSISSLTEALRNFLDPRHFLRPEARGPLRFKITFFRPWSF